MRKIIKTTIVCAFLFAFSALSVNAQYCSAPGCTFNTANISGPTTINFYDVATYSLPNITGASYSWSVDGYEFFVLAKHENGTGSSAMFTTPYYKFDGYYQWGMLDPHTGNILPGWYLAGTYFGVTPGIEKGTAYCTVVCNHGHTHYFSKKVTIILQ